ncbi:MAG: ABC transporter ATP-binding protein [Treponema sp.]|nr:ABC transporter ATP-binding protein [Treponema sp.]
MKDKLFCKNLSANYKTGSQTKQILNNVSIEIEQGEFVCLCGPNGSGKSTLMTILAGLGNTISNLKITDVEQEPSIMHNSRYTKLSDFTQKQIAQNIALMQQNEYSTWDFTVKELILQGRYSYSKNGWYSQNDHEIVEKIIHKMNLTEYAERNIHSLSGGEFQKVRIARALAQTPKFLLLDEPSSSLDFIYEPKLLESLKKIAKEEDIAVLISIHDVNLASRMADKIAFLPPQKPLICDTVENIFTEENLLYTYNTELQIYEHSVYNKKQVLCGKIN